MKRLSGVLAIVCVCLMIASGLIYESSVTDSEHPLQEVGASGFPATYEFDDKICLWTNKNQSDPGFPYPYEDQAPSVGMEFFRTHYVNVPPIGQANGYSAVELNDPAHFPAETKMVVEMPTGLVLASWVEGAQIVANEARNNSRIIGVMWDDFSVGKQSAANMSAVYAAAHHEDANLTQGDLKLFLVVYSYNYFLSTPYTWAQVDPYYDAIEYWFYANSYGLEGPVLAGYEDGARALYAMNTSKTIWLGVYMHYYNAGTYPYEVTYDLLSIDARLISEGLAERISVIANFWIPNEPEVAYLIRNFLANEMCVDWVSTWTWSSDAIVTTKDGVAAAGAVSEVTTKWTGNKTFFSHHHQNVSVTGFTGNNLTVQSIRTGEIITTTKTGSTWWFYASPNEEYKICNWPRTPVTYATSQTLESATSWNNKEIRIEGWLRVNASLWVNNTIIRFFDPAYLRSIWTAVDPNVGLISNLSNNPKIYLENSTIEPVERMFPFFFNCTWSATGTSKVFSIHNSTLACVAGDVSWMGYTRIFDSVVYEMMPDDASYSSLKEYAPSTANEFKFARNLVWGYNNAFITGFSMVPGSLNGSGNYLFTDNRFFGGRLGIYTDGGFSSDTDFSNLVLGSVTNFDQKTPKLPYVDLNCTTAGSEMWFKVKFQLKTDVAISGTLKNAGGTTIGIYSSSGGYINVSNILYAHLDDACVLEYRNPFPWTFNFSTSLSATRYYALADECKYSMNRTSWEYPYYQVLNASSFSIALEQATTLHLKELDREMQTGAANYVTSKNTITWADQNHAQRKYNWTTPGQVSMSVATDQGVLSVADLAYNPQGAAGLVASWESDNTVSAAVGSFDLSGLVPTVRYQVFLDSTLRSTLTASAGGTISFTCTSWSSHTFEIYRLPAATPPHVPPSSDTDSGTGTVDTAPWEWGGLSVIIVASISVVMVLLLMLNKPRSGRTRRS